MSLSEDFKDYLDAKNGILASRKLWYAEVKPQIKDALNELLKQHSRLIGKDRFDVAEFGPENFDQIALVEKNAPSGISIESKSLDRVGGILSFHLGPRGKISIYSCKPYVEILEGNGGNIDKFYDITDVDEIDNEAIEEVVSDFIGDLADFYSSEEHTASIGFKK